MINELAPRLQLYLKRFTGNDADADDIFQETLLKIRNGYSSFDRRASIHSWAYRIATNAAIDYFRKFSRELPQQVEPTATESDDEDDDRLVIDEMNQCVRGVIDRLPADYRAVTVLFHLEDKSIRQIADILNITPSATRVRIHRGKQLLKEALGHQCVMYVTREGTVHCDRKQ